MSTSFNGEPKATVFETAKPQASANPGSSRLRLAVQCCKQREAGKNARKTWLRGSAS